MKHSILCGMLALWNGLPDHPNHQNLFRLNMIKIKLTFLFKKWFIYRYLQGMKTCVYAYTRVNVRTFTEFYLYVHSFYHNVTHNKTFKKSYFLLKWKINEHFKHINLANVLLNSYLNCSSNIIHFWNKKNFHLKSQVIL